MTSSDEDPEIKLDQALGEIRRIMRGAEDVVSAIPDPQRSFKLATWWADAVRQLADEATDLRVRAVKKIWDSETTSLSGLAQKIGVSKARAGQLMKSAKKIEDTNPSSADKQGED